MTAHILGNGHMSEVSNEEVIRLIKAQSDRFTDHMARFENHKKDWETYRGEAEVAIAQISTLHQQIGGIANYAQNLSQLPAIAQALQNMEKGLLHQNKTLIGQNDTLLKPATRAQNMLSNIIMMTMVLVTAIFIVILVRQYQMNVSVFGDRGIKIEQSHPPQSPTK